MSERLGAPGTTRYRSLDGASDAALDDWCDDYRWYAQVCAAIHAETDDDDLLWEHLGPKTRQLVHEHMRNVRIADWNVAVVVADAETIRKMSETGQLPPVPTEHDGKSVQEILDSLTARIQRKLDGGSEDALRYSSIAEHLDQLRQKVIATAEGIAIL